ncbi:MAG: 50S ribosomal protein L10 [Deltaproteobacteria bacterium RIFCSPLOWO2_12_FULL_44_12]|nr:MAG: 50S ribosomal protein L10 [Deltaproteobacteria bacterium RIFCSPHIGHO2_01_FULL_43_49]OGQ14868.1 MAG: 50S ribosomal protein L10 [Deltaproteobacteria bacterium RIFCSPHIGHO2_02_FULL_44_53]OGQ28270.1 MAG: 50S ribosomal protein L10 [Deltaproteobacteria bacterium RIFCSPHIGHO2_12_FULL_44_21]OGQ30875.1 MAG: 50S ribosomal protein L10 [Deltaproteobacteria bacterium RIFCSPLOWO2_01_FULL_45_74]OGQ42553.1 MAG: 50S ribosomal protein L10 [Deltaproteobacteria bacterium RIFCSPLOWO2_02_FULL_44_34]OGQ70264
MNRDQKVKEVEVLKERFQKAKALIFAENKGLKVSEVTELRKKLRVGNSSLKTVKNRLVKRALKDIKVEGLDNFFDGPTTIASSEVDPVSPAKILVNFIKDHESLVIKGGYLGGEILSLDKIKSLAALPSKEVLYAKLLACLLNPARGLVSVLAAMPRQLVTVIDAIKKTKET